jgi:hypothetical protein
VDGNEEASVVRWREQLQATGRLTEFVKMPALIAKAKPSLLATDLEKILPEFMKLSFGFAIVLEIILPGLRSMAPWALSAV